MDLTSGIISVKLVRLYLQIFHSACRRTQRESSNNYFHYVTVQLQHFSFLISMLPKLVFFDSTHFFTNPYHISVNPRNTYFSKHQAMKFWHL